MQLNVADASQNEKEPNPWAFFSSDGGRLPIDRKRQRSLLNISKRDKSKNSDVVFGASGIIIAMLRTHPLKFANRFKIKAAIIRLLCSA